MFYFKTHANFRRQAVVDAPSRRRTRFFQDAGCRPAAWRGSAGTPAARGCWGWRAPLRGGRPGQARADRNPVALVERDAARPGLRLSARRVASRSAQRIAADLRAMGL